MDHPGSGGSLGSVRSIRMGGAGIFGDIERADRSVCGTPCASCEVDWRASAGGSDDLGFVPRRSAGCQARGVARRHTFDEVLALLAALVPAPILSLLL